jgi:DNA-binding PadR family transcriptional regulator
MVTQETLLGILNTGMNYGYEIKQMHDALFGQSKAMGFSTVYATLGRLQRDGYVCDQHGETMDGNSVIKSGGPSRVCYRITNVGRERLLQWLSEPEPPVPNLQFTIYLKTVLCLLNDGLYAAPAAAPAAPAPAPAPSRAAPAPAATQNALNYLDLQKHAHIEQMRSLTKQKLQAKADGKFAEVLLIDHAILHLDADVKWINETVEKIDILKENLKWD